MPEDVLRVVLSAVTVLFFWQEVASYRRGKRAGGQSQRLQAQRLAFRGGAIMFVSMIAAYTSYYLLPKWMLLIAIAGFVYGFGVVVVAHWRRLRIDGRIR